MAITLGRGRQKEIYLNGFLGRKIRLPFDFNELEKQAENKLGKKAFGYIAAGAGSSRGIQNNLDAFCDYTILPRMLNGSDHPELGLSIFNTQLPFPLLFAPVGVLGLAHPKGDLEMTEASKLTGMPMIQSNQASFSMEACAEVLHNTDHWFQLYFGKSRDLVESMVHRAKLTGNKAIVLTLDTTILGWRNKDLANGFLPFMYGLGIAQYTADPVFKQLMEKCDLTTGEQLNARPGIQDAITLFSSYPDSLINNFKTRNPVKAVKTFLDLFSKTDLSWDDVRWLREQTKLPLLLKGILHPEDARKAIDYGIDGIIVSNHGGRQVDHVHSTLDSIVEIKKVIPEEFPLILDSGIRKAADIFIAMALGAKAVCVGRPYVYALALGGRDAVVEYIQNLVSELQITMSLVGCKSLSEINRDCIQNK